MEISVITGRLERKQVGGNCNFSKHHQKSWENIKTEMLIMLITHQNDQKSQNAEHKF